jgi:hypothetical protein
MRLRRSDAAPGSADRFSGLGMLGERPQGTSIGALDATLDFITSKRPVESDKCCAEDDSRFHDGGIAASERHDRLTGISATTFWSRNCSKSCRSGTRPFQSAETRGLVNVPFRDARTRSNRPRRAKRTLMEPRT